MNRTGRKNPRGLFGPFHQTDRAAVEQLLYTRLAGFGLVLDSVKIGMIEGLPAGKLVLVDQRKTGTG